jgi:Mn2+/Fe2+ NRAMP family transporter
MAARLGLRPDPGDRGQFRRVAVPSLAPPDWSPVAAAFLPTPALVADPAMLLLGIGIIGATVMPHNLYLHSGLLAPVCTESYIRQY